MSDLREPHERPDTCSAAELADILDRFIALPSTEAIFKAAAKKLRALSAEPAQEMTDTQVRAVVIEYLSSTKAHTDAWRRFTYDSGPYEVTCVRHDTMGLLRAAIAADRASRLPAVTECNDKDSPWLVCKTCAARGLCAKSLPEMGEDDWPEMPEPAMEDVPYELWGQNVTHPALYTADQLRAHAAAAVEAYKALVRGKT